MRSLHISVAQLYAIAKDRHDFSAPNDGSARQASAQNFRKCRDVGQNPRGLLHASRRVTEPCNDFVKNEKAAVRLGGVSQSLKKFGAPWKTPGTTSARFDNHSCNISGVDSFQRLLKLYGR